jgi:hypothetical protein
MSNINHCTELLSQDQHYWENSAMMQAGKPSRDREDQNCSTKEDISLMRIKESPSSQLRKPEPSQPLFWD